MINNLYKKLMEANIKTRRNVALKPYTTLYIGGKAALFCEPETISQMQTIITLTKEENIPYFILGKGSNLLVDDRGYDGVILYLGAKFSRIEVKENEIFAQSGATLKQISHAAMQHGLEGFAFACGIPGSAGGGVVMNAGAYGGEMKDVIKEVTYLDENNQIITKSNTDLEFDYRHSFFSNHKGIVLTIRYQLHPGVREEIQHHMEELMSRRYAKQPMEHYSAGSTFKRPKNDYASRLIKASNLANYQIHDAQVSSKHTGFLINRGNASSDDFLALIQFVKKKVKENSGIELQNEIRYLHS